MCAFSLPCRSAVLAKILARLRKLLLPTSVGNWQEKVTGRILQPENRPGSIWIIVDFGLRSLETFRQVTTLPKEIFFGRMTATLWPSIRTQRSGRCSGTSIVKGPKDIVAIQKLAWTKVQLTETENSVPPGKLL